MPFSIGLLSICRLSWIVWSFEQYRFSKQEHGIYFHLFVVFSFFRQCLIVFRVQVFCLTLCRFIPRYLILFDVMTNKIVLLIFLSDFLLLMYRNVTNF